MAKAIVIYDTRTGHTEAMAKEICEGIKDEGLDCDLMKADCLSIDALPGYDAIVIGSPTYYGSMTAEIKKRLDESVKFHGKLEGKVGGAFASSANVGGGNETTILHILEALLIHGMIVKGVSKGDHYGPVAINAPDKKALQACRKYARGIAQLTKTICGA
jgi:NAD(P)H dehydrogenase (quinone)